MADSRPEKPIILVGHVKGDPKDLPEGIVYAPARDPDAPQRVSPEVEVSDDPALIAWTRRAYEADLDARFATAIEEASSHPTQWGSRKWWYSRTIPFYICIAPIGCTMSRGQVNMIVVALTAGMFLAVIVVAIVVFLAGASARPVPVGHFGWAGLLLNGPFLILTAITSVFCSALAFCLQHFFRSGSG